LASGGGLGSLAQSARTNQLRSARGILYAVGILTVLVNLVFVVFAKSIVDSQFETELKELRGRGVMIDQGKLEEIRATAIRSTQLVNGIGVLMGAVFIACAVMVYTYPVPTTITSLVLYIGAAALFGVIDPTTLARGWIMKVLVIVGLFKAVQAAI